VDNNVYPIYDNPLDDQPAGSPLLDTANEGDNFLPYNLSTPIAYITEINPDFIDVFQSLNEGPGRAEYHNYHYKNSWESEDYMFTAYTSQFLLLGLTDPGQAGYSGLPVQWLVGSHGPCLMDLDFTIPYDPTNGATSLGNLARFGPGFPGNGQ
jgi:hypothetical protein